MPESQNPHNPETAPLRDYAAELGLVDGKFEVARSGDRPNDTEGWFIKGTTVEKNEDGTERILVHLTNPANAAQGLPSEKARTPLEKLYSWQPVNEADNADTIPNERLRELRQEGLRDAHEQLEEAPKLVKDTGEVALQDVVESPDPTHEEESVEIESRVEAEESVETDAERSEYLKSEIDRIAQQVTELESQIGSIDRLAEKLQQDAIENGGSAKKKLVETLEDYSRSFDDLTRRAASGDYPLDSLITLSGQFARDSHGISTRFRGLRGSLQDSMASDVRRYKSAVGDMYEKVARAANEINAVGSEISANSPELSEDAEVVNKINDTIQKIITMKGGLETKQDALSAAKLLDASGFDQRFTDELQSMILSYQRDAEQLPDITRRHGVEGTVSHAGAMKKKLMGIIASAQASTR